MRWATRTGVHIDRAACAWLIRRFIDPKAEFVFVDDVAHVPAKATAFDMRGVELSHRGGDCTFETVLRGLSLTGTDEATMAVSGPIFDGLYEFYRRCLLLDREPA